MRPCRSKRSKYATEDGVYLVDSIIAERSVKNQKFYKVRWEGFTPAEDSWEPEENLSNVRDLIYKFHQKNSKSLPDCSTSSSSSSPIATSFPRSTHIILKTSRSRSHNEFLNSQKGGMTKSRSGHFEYVPQNKLVASKTKYFDDIRDGKIDLSSNDLYSRVKMRRRCLADISGQSANEDSLSRPESLNEMTEQDTDSATPSRYSAPSSPKHLTRSTDGSVDECVSVMSDSTNTIVKSDSIHSSRQISSLLNALTSPICSRRRHLKRSRFSKHRRLSKICFVPILQPQKQPIANKIELTGTSPVHNELKISTGQNSDTTETANERKLSIHTLESTPIPRSPSDEVYNVEDQNKEFSIDSQISEFEDLRQTVPSSEALIENYFELIHGDYTQAGFADPDCLFNQLRNLPILEPIEKSFSVYSKEDLISAITHQRWSLLASCPSFELSSILQDSETQLTGKKEENRSSSPILPSRVPNNYSRHPLVAAIIHCEGSPFILNRLLKCGLSSDLIDPVSGWPVLSIAVYFGRIHAARVLLDANAQPNTFVNFGGRSKTALGIAISIGDVDMATLLILNGANFYQVEKETTALKLIIYLLNSITTGSSDSSRGSSGGFNNGVTICGVEKNDNFRIVMDNFQKKLHQNSSTNPCSMPLLTPPNAISIPCSPYNYLTSTCFNIQQDNAKFSDQLSNQLPSPTALTRLYELIACHHARLSIAVDALVRRWLTSIHFVQTSLVMPCQWINLRQNFFSLSFSTPSCLKTVSASSESTFDTITSSAPFISTTNCDKCIPFLLLIHGTITPPGCYHVWMEDEGPCFVEKVSIGQVDQKPLGRSLFVTTLIPFDRACTKQTISVSLIPQNLRINISNEDTRSVCIAAIIISAKPAPPKTADCTVMPCPRIVPINSCLRQRLQ